MKRAIAIILLALACAGALAIAGCQTPGKGSLGSDIDEKTGSYTVTADDAGKGSAVDTSGGITIAEGQLLAVSPDLAKGSLQVKLTGSAGEKLEVEASGRVLSTYEPAAGEYGIAVTCNEDGTTGRVLVVPVDKAELARQNSDLAATLKEMRNQQ